MFASVLVIHRRGQWAAESRTKRCWTKESPRSCPGMWCNSGEAVVITGVAGSIKPPPRRAA
jgi:hypothetical protein